MKARNENQKVVSLDKYRKHRSTANPSIHATIENGELKYAADNVTANDVRPLLLAIMSIAIDLTLKIQSTAIYEVAETLDGVL